MNNLSANNYINRLEHQIDASIGKIKSRQKKDYQSSVSGTFDENSYSYHSKVENYAYNLLSNNIGWQMHQEYSYLSKNNFYASASYQKSAEVLKDSTVIIDFMFTGNREFDFKI